MRVDEDGDRDGVRHTRTGTGAVSVIGLAAGVIGTFFAAGIVAGALIVALPRVWRRRRHDMHQESGWQEPPSLGGDAPPRWPGQ